MLVNYSINPDPADYGERVFFNVNFTDADGDVVEYMWNSSIDGFLSSSSSFSTEGLSSGHHLIYVKARDNDGRWSEQHMIDFQINYDDSGEHKPTIRDTMFIL